MILLGNSWLGCVDCDLFFWGYYLKKDYVWKWIRCWRFGLIGYLFVWFVL